MLRTLKGMAAGAIVGVAVSAVMLPQLDRRTQKNLRRVGKRAAHMAGDAYDMMMDYMR